jgi:transcriptional regulator with XRE-family HTH domain
MEYKAYLKLPNQLRKYRKLRGLTQKQVSKILGLKSSSRISRWETGKCLPSVKNTIRLAIVLRVNADDLFWDLRKAILEEVREGGDIFRKRF